MKAKRHFITGLCLATFSLSSGASQTIDDVIIQNNQTVVSQASEQVNQAIILAEAASLEEVVEYQQIKIIVDTETNLLSLGYLDERNNYHEVLESKIITGKRKKKKKDLDWSTPKGTYQIDTVIVNPRWYIPKSIYKEMTSTKKKRRQFRKKVKEGVYVKIGKRRYYQVPGPDNPLGQFKLRLGHTKIMIHGTNHPELFEKKAEKRYRSHGCIRVEEVRPLTEYILENTPHEPEVNSDGLSGYLDDLTRVTVDLEYPVIVEVK